MLQPWQGRRTLDGPDQAPLHGRDWSTFCFGAAIWRHVFPGPPPPQSDTPRLPPALLVVINGFLVLGALSALISI